MLDLSFSNEIWSKLLIYRFLQNIVNLNVQFHLSRSFYRRMSIWIIQSRDFAECSIKIPNTVEPNSFRFTWPE